MHVCMYLIRTDRWRRFTERNVLDGCGSSIIAKLLLMLTRQANSRLAHILQCDELAQSFVVATQRYYFALKST